MVFWILATGVLCLTASLIAAEHASGHMPFSGYDEERFWGRVSFALFFVGAICFGVATYLGMSSGPSA